MAASPMRPPGPHPARQAAEAAALGWLARHRQAMLEDLLALLAIESVEGPPRPGRPFGDGVGQALEFVEALGRRLGLRTLNVDGYAVHAEGGPGGETVGVLCHVDVVPAGSGWSVPPFAGTLRDGRIYGRGSLDDKGPTVASLYAAAAALASGAPLTRRIRVIVGGDEESGFECVRYYFRRHPTPELAFSPDALFPVVFAEKGNLMLTLGRDVVRSRVRRARAGEHANVVPDRAELELAVPPGDRPDAWAQRLRRAAGARRARIVVEEPPLGPTREPALRLVAYGEATHGSVPEKGINAAAELLACVAEADGGERRLDLDGSVTFLARAGTEVYGRGLGIARRDDISGLLTVNLGLLRWEAGRVRATFDIRYPVSEGSAAGILQAAAAAAAAAGFAVQAAQDDPPHHVDPDSFLVRALLEVYREETGDDLGPLAIGGGTYARALPNAVAFGPAFPLQGAIPHERDEYIAVDHFYQLARIYARALLALAL